MDLAEKNKIIAEFMGAKIELIDNNYHSFDWHGKKYSITPTTWNDTPEKTLLKLYEFALNPEFGRLGQFHKDWNWLMQVVEKIESILPNDGVITIEYKDCKIPFGEDFYVSENAGTKIQAVYNACIIFINWYNQQQN